ncbi:MAG TPA: T9SS type A sorting domain-containing protein, partial [Chitinophagales bacterium]|nr:T9SS type A sorting domain-containing protein [Chitinophagales bacterium]
FLEAQDGNAGQIKTKMLLELTDDFIHGLTLTSQTQICSIYSNCFNTGSSYSDYTCNGQPYQFFNQQLNATGTYYHTLTSSYGCDSTIRIDLTVLPVSATTQTQTACNSYNFVGHELTTSGTYQDTLTNINGCDSVVTLNLTINQPVSYSYNTVVCAGTTYSFNGTELTASGVYTNVLTAVNGCDSVVQLTLLVDTVPDVTLTINADTILPDNHAILLTGGSPAGGIYTGTGVSGNVFFPLQAGQGVHNISYTYTDAYGCSDTAVTQIVILSTGISEPDTKPVVAVFPNPARGSVNITAPQGSRVFVCTATGSAVKAAVVTRAVETLDISNLSAGIYTIQVVTAYGVVTQKLAVQ